MIGAVGTAIYGITFHNTLLATIAVFGFITCYQQRAAIQAGASTYGEEYETAYLSGPQIRGRSGGGFIQRWRHRRNMIRLQERARRQRELEEEVDRILEKVSHDGLHSLSRREKRTLQQATELQRQE